MDAALVALAAAVVAAGPPLGHRLAGAARRRRRLRTIRGLTALSPVSFERTVGGWMSRSGWLVEERGGAGDEGIDLLAFRDGRVVAVQCKRYQPTAAVPASQVRELYGSAAAIGADAAILVTTGRVTGPAMEWVARLPGTPTRMEVVNGEALARIARARRWDPGHA